MHSLEISILKTVSYFDVFDYPLASNEMLFFLDRPATEKEITGALEQLVITKQLWQFNDLYSIRNETGLVSRRLQGNELAGKYIKKARSVAKFLSWFPYIRGIAISGSLSKKFADKDSDLDFFIITKPNRLWIVRMLYSILCKIAYVGRINSWFCLNYFIDESELEIKEKNVFTAVEVSTLLPLKGKTAFRNFFNANRWVYQYQPNYEPDYIYLKDASPIIFKRITEWLLNFKPGDKLDDKLHLIFKKRFERVLAQNIVTDTGFTVGSYEVSKHACKPMPEYFQPKILAKFLERFAFAKDKYLKERKKEKVL